MTMLRNNLHTQDVSGANSFVQAEQWKIYYIDEMYQFYFPQQRKYQVIQIRRTKLTECNCSNTGCAAGV